MDQAQLWNAGPVKITSRSKARQLRRCREPGCTKLARAKQGASYCEDHARSIDYGPIRTENTTFKEEIACINCTKPFKRWRQGSYLSAWSEFCPTCHAASPLTSAQLRAHNVPGDLAKTWLAQGKNLSCDYCSSRLDRRTNRRPTIDHDHRCCPGERSCGKCIRGVLCTRCNTYLGHLEQLLEIKGIDEALAYLG